ncbi:hypothetical protein KAJ27_25340 [bacterium]|nr:hypothetical protein [bacterium]
MNKHRTKKMHLIALKNGYDFYETDPGYNNMISDSNYQLLNLGHSGKIRNIFSRQKEIVAGQSFLPGTMLIFDYSYTTTSGSKPIIYTQTVLSFKCKGLVLPSFYLHEEGFLNSLVTKLKGVQDIDFKNYPRFSNKYHLGGNEEETRDFFDHSLLSFFENFPEPIRVETNNNSVIIYTHQRKLEENDIITYSEILERIVAIFKIRMGC